jgi:hypothetical protein
LYEDIKKIYGRLPEKDRKKVYDIINGYWGIENLKKERLLLESWKKAKKHYYLL